MNIYDEARGFGYAENEMFVPNAFGYTKNEMFVTNNKKYDKELSQKWSDVVGRAY